MQPNNKVQNQAALLKKTNKFEEEVSTQPKLSKHKFLFLPTKLERSWQKVLTSAFTSN